VTRLTPEQVGAIKHLLVPMADDEWMIAHRGSEWLGLAPDLEEDLAQNSTTQDEMGHAQRLYMLLHDMGLAEPEDWVYNRDPLHWHHAVLTAKPRDGWAEWVVRRYLYEVADWVRRDALSHIPYPPLVASLHKMDREEAYHLAHYRTLMATLAHGGPTSRGFLMQALTDDWPLTADLFQWVGSAENWAIWDVGALAPSAMMNRFLAQVRIDFSPWHLEMPPLTPAPRSARHHGNSRDLARLVEEMVSVRRIAPDSPW
jgi:ring-1,2-phenylacetyl-CoA epoxidase subunit PaaC